MFAGDSKEIDEVLISFSCSLYRQITSGGISLLLSSSLLNLKRRFDALLVDAKKNLVLFVEGTGDGVTVFVFVCICFVKDLVSRRVAIAVV
jgi:hypothetical protein